MKNFFSIVVWFFFAAIFGLPTKVCAQFSDDFSDGDFTDNPPWTGTTHLFAVDNNRLRLMAPPQAGTAWLVTSSSAIEDATWECWVRLDFNPSSSNYVRVYLSSSSHDLSGPLNGYYVMIGDAADEVSLYRQTGTSRTKIIDGLDGRVNVDPVVLKIRVTRSRDGLWQLFTDVGLTGNYTLEGEVTDTQHRSSSWFGIFCNYTSTRSTLFYFDDFVVTGEPYVPPPPSSFKQVIFTELLPDPIPPLQLPEAEFVELFNRSAQTVNLENWRFSDAQGTAVLPRFELEPGRYVILTSTAAAALFQVFGPVIALPSFPTLNNSGDRLTLRDAYDNLIDQVNYTDRWYRDDDKRNGGWTLELIDTENICAEQSNWAASEDPTGGTPGRRNSIAGSNPDLTGPRLLSAFPLQPTQLQVTFNEKMQTELPEADAFSITPHIPVADVLQGPTPQEWILTLGAAIQPGISYRLTVSRVRDCSGNLIDEQLHSTIFGWPETPAAGDVVVNEILFNPRPYGVDFVEVYNRSEKFINLKNWRVGNYRDDAFINPQPIADNNLLLPPHQVMAFTTDPLTILSHYPSSARGNITQVSKLPSFPDDAGSVCVIMPDNNISDYFLYDKSYHSVFLRDKEGVSLERIDVDSETNNPHNWKSASSTAGFATPGLLNSQARQGAFLSGEVTVHPEIFVPIYGQPNFTEIRYAFDSGGKMVNVKILDQQGREIKQLASNELIGTQGFFRWDGDRSDGSQAMPGYYLVWFEAFDGTGRTISFRRRVVIAARR